MKGVNGKLIVDVGLFVLSNVALYFGVKYVIAQMDPFHKKKAKAKSTASHIFGRLGVTTKDLQLTEYEEVIATELIHPDDISITFKDVGGLDTVIKSLQENVIYPLKYPDLYSSFSSLLGCPKGVLLYGPPGCGKTMLAKALAKESGAIFINLHVSTLTDKWFGESQKLVHGLFSLALKLQPCIIFIDEIDSFLRERKSFDHEATSMMKAEFMSLWDGLSGSDQNRVMILGATNRPNDIDKAILRRMPRRFHITVPDRDQRRRILSLLLQNTQMDASFDLGQVVAQTEGYSGSDLKELCRNAAMGPVREFIKTLKDSGLLDQHTATAAISSREGVGRGDDSAEPQQEIHSPTLPDVDLKTLKVRPLMTKDFFEGVTIGASTAYVDLD